jgi:type I restriction enzyme S subunit
MYLRTFDFSSLGSTSSIATAVNSRTIKNMDVLVPNKGALAKFDEITTPIFKLISSVEQQSQKEEMIRDMLLPRVITNQV